MFVETIHSDREEWATWSQRLRLTEDPPDGLVLVRADPTSLQRVLTNLLENASKFSPEGTGIRLSAETVVRSGASARADSSAWKRSTTSAGAPPRTLVTHWSAGYQSATRIRSRKIWVSSTLRGPSHSSLTAASRTSRQTATR